MKKALLVGSCGFIGRALGAMLVRSGYEVLGVDGVAAREATYVYREGLYETLEPLIRDTGFIVYAAGSLLPRMDTPVNTAFDRDCRPFNELVQSAVKARSKARLLLISSGGAVYGTETGQLTESSPTRPASAYGLTRLFMEQSLLFHTRGTAIEPMVFRLANVYGPGQRPEGASALIINVLRAAAGHGPLTLWGDGQQTKDFLFLDDLVEAVRRALPEVRPGPLAEAVFNIATGTSHSVLEVIELARKVSGRDVPLVRVEGPKTDVPHVWLSSERAQRVLGWTAATSLEEGIRRYWKALEAS